MALRLSTKRLSTSLAVGRNVRILGVSARQASTATNLSESVINDIQVCCYVQRSLLFDVN
jgi:hypothetical protein